MRAPLPPHVCPHAEAAEAASAQLRREAETAKAAAQADSERLTAQLAAASAAAAPKAPESAKKRKIADPPAAAAEAQEAPEATPMQANSPQGVRSRAQTPPPPPRPLSLSYAHSRRNRTASVMNHERNTDDFVRLSSRSDISQAAAEEKVNPADLTVEQIKTKLTVRSGACRKSISASIMQSW